MKHVKCIVLTMLFVVSSLCAIKTNEVIFNLGVGRNQLRDCALSINGFDGYIQLIINETKKDAFFRKSISHYFAYLKELENTKNGIVVIFKNYKDFKGNSKAKRDLKEKLLNGLDALRVSLQRIEKNEKQKAIKWSLFQKYHKELLAFAQSILALQKAVYNYINDDKSTIECENKALQQALKRNIKRLILSDLSKKEENLNKLSTFNILKK